MSWDTVCTAQSIPDGAANAKIVGKLHGTIGAWTGRVTSKRTSAFVLIVSRNTSTARSLQSYFDHCGVGASISHRLEMADDSPPFTSVVVFPDEFPAHAAAEGLRGLARRFPQALLVVVTRDVGRFERLAQELMGAHPGRLFVLPRPIWGWALLDRVLQPLSPNQQISDSGRDETEDE